MAQPNLSIKFNAVNNVSGPVRRMNKNVTGFTRRSQKGFRSVGDSIRRMKGLLVGAGAVLGAGKIAHGITRFTEQADEIGKTARQLGVGVEALQELQFAAERQGVSVDNLDKSMKAMNNRLGKLRAGQGQLSTMLKETNPQLLEQLKTTDDSEEAFNLLMKEMNGMESQARKTALAQAAFSSTGRELVRMSEAGVEGINELRQQAQDTGNVMSEEATKGSEKFQDALTNLKSSMGGLRNQALVPLIDKITPMIKRVSDWISENQNLIKTKVKGFIQGVKDVVSTLKTTVQAFMPVIKALITQFVLWKIATSAVTAKLLIMRGAFAIKKFFQLVRVIRMIIRAKKGWAAIQGILNVLMKANPIGLIITGVSALIGVVIALVKNWDKVKESLKGVWDILKGVFEWITKTIGKVLEFLGLVDKTKEKKDEATEDEEERRGSRGIAGTALGDNRTENRRTRDDGEESNRTENRRTRNGPIAQPISANAGVQESRTRHEEIKEQRVQVDFSNLPEGATVRQDGEGTPGVSMNYGYAGAGA